MDVEAPGRGADGRADAVHATRPAGGVKHRLGRVSSPGGPSEDGYSGDSNGAGRSALAQGPPRADARHASIAAVAVSAAPVTASEADGVIADGADSAPLGAAHRTQAQATGRRSTRMSELAAISMRLRGGGGDDQASWRPPAPHGGPRPPPPVPRPPPPRGMPWPSRGRPPATPAVPTWRQHQGIPQAVWPPPPPVAGFPSPYNPANCPPHPGCPSPHAAPVASFVAISASRPAHPSAYRPDVALHAASYPYAGGPAAAPIAQPVAAPWLPPPPGYPFPNTAPSVAAAADDAPAVPISSPPPDFPCTTCNLVFGSRNELFKHFNERHDGVPQPRPARPRPPSGPAKAVQSGPPGARASDATAAFGAGASGKRRVDFEGLGQPTDVAALAQRLVGGLSRGTLSSREEVFVEELRKGLLQASAYP